MSSNATSDSDTPIASTSTSLDKTAANASDDSLDSFQFGTQVQEVPAQATDIAQSDSSAGDTETEASSSDGSLGSLPSGIQVEGDANVQTVTQSSSSSAAKATSTVDASSASTTAKTTSTSNSSSTSATSSSTSTSSAAKTSGTSTSSTSGSASQSSTSLTSTATSTLTSASSHTESAQGVAFVTTASNGQITTITTDVTPTASGTIRPTESPQSLSAADSFLRNKPAMGAVFGVAGLVALIALLAIVLKIVRYRANRKFERELDEKVAEEVRAGTPMSFGFGKEDDGMSITGGRGGGGLGDPERAYGGGAYANQAGFGVGYGAANTSAYATYGGAAALPAFYSPNPSNSAPRRFPSDPTQYMQYNNGGNGLERIDSHTSARSYGTLNQAPMNAFGPNSNAPGANSSFAPATFAANYGEYRHASPAPSTQSWQSQSQTPFGARPGTPSALTPGGRGTPTPGPALPRGVYVPLGARSDSPAVLGRYNPSHSPQNSKDGQGAYAAEAYVSGSGQSPRAQTQGGLAVPVRGPEPSSPNGLLPNPFDQNGQ